MNLGNKYAAKLIIGALVVLLIIAHTLINVKVAANIAATIADINNGLEEAGAPPHFLEYGELSYSFLYSTITLKDVVIDDKDKFDFRAKEVRLKLNRNDFDEIEALEDLSDLTALEISDLRIAIEGMQFNFDNEVEAWANQLEIEFKGTIANMDNDPELLVNHLVVLLKEADLGDNQAYLGVASMELILDSDQQLNLMELDELDPTFVTVADDFDFYWKIKGLELPAILSRELELDNLGLGRIEAESILVESNIDNKEFAMVLALEAKGYGTFNVDASLDFGENKDDPYMYLGLHMEDLDRKLDRLFRGVGFESNGDKGYDFEYDGLMSGMEGVLSGF